MYLHLTCLSVLYIGYILYCCRYYGYLYYTYYNNSLQQHLVEETDNCEDLLMNFLVSHLTRLPPIKVTQRRGLRDDSGVGETELGSVERLAQRSLCVDSLVDVYGYMPLYRSNIRLDPLLWKDNVAITRKKYRKMERVP